MRAAPISHAVLCALGAGALLGGCSTRGGGFERDVVVNFTLPAGIFTPPSASVAAIEKNCPGSADARMEPVPGPDALPSVRLNGIRFNVAGADDRMISDLIQCLQAQPDVKTAALEDEDS